MTETTNDSGTSTSDVGVSTDELDSIVRAIGDHSNERLPETIETLSPSDHAYVIAHLDDQQTQQVFDQIGSDRAASVIEGLSNAQAAQTLAAVEPQVAAGIFHHLHSDGQADLIGLWNDDVRDSILAELPKRESRAARQMAAYKTDTAGGLMVSELLRFPLESTVRQVIDELAGHAESLDDRDVRYGYVTDGPGRLAGVLPMQQLIFFRRATPIADVMIAQPLSVTADTELEALADLFDSHHFLAVPVVDDNQTLLGVVHREAVLQALQNSADRDYLKSQGIVGGEELRTMPLWLRAKRRLSWLSVNVFLNLGAAAVIATFQDTLQAAIALAIFLPIISDMSGCSGNQAVAVSMRELALGLIRPQETFRVWMKEASVGLINGVALGLLIAIVAVLYDGNAYLGLVVGLALFANTLIAVSIGGTIPLVLKRFGFDPAVASGPLLTTVTDMCGFFIVLGLATLMLDRLTGN